MEGLDWVAGCAVSRETIEKLHSFAESVIDENTRQNLISRSSEADIWSRHILDSVQLIRFATGRNGRWMDLGSGPGFPGLVIALIRDLSTLLVESRPRRAEFLEAQAKRLGLVHVRVHPHPLERLETQISDVISARAFAPLARLLPLATRFATPETLWILPKGKSAAEELESVRATWHGDFRIEASLTDPRCGIIVATDVRRKA